MSKDKSAGNNPLSGFISLAGACLGAAIILLGVPYLFGLLASGPGIAGMPAYGLESIFTLVTFGLLAALALGAIRLLRLPLRYGGPGLAAVGLGLGVAGCGCSVALCIIAGTAHAGSPPPPGIGLILLETLLVLFQSWAEEVYFRGWLQGDLTRRWGPMPALAVAALAFALLHFLAGASDPLSFVTLLLGGLLFGLCYQRSGGLALPWALHFGWNWSEELFFGLYPNPGVGTFGALINLDLSGPAIWGGSGEGLNASLSSYIVLAALLCAVWFWPRPRAA